MDNCPIFLKKKTYFSRQGVSFIEILIVLTVIGLLAVFVLSFLNPQVQLGKARDGKRKADLKKLGTVLGDYYNDHNCYPVFLNCGESLAPYLPKIPCDPFTNQSYGYTADCSSYRLYAKLENKKDPAIAAVGCQNGCGPGGVYNFGVTSGNVSLEVGQPSLTPTPPPSGCTWYACQTADFCNQYSQKPSCSPIFCNDPTCGGGCSRAKVCQ